MGAVVASNWSVISHAPTGRWLIEVQVHAGSDLRDRDGLTWGAGSRLAADLLHDAVEKWMLGEGTKPPGCLQGELFDAEG